MRSRRGMRAAVVATAVVSAVASCGDGGGLGAGPDDVVPFEPRPAELPGGDAEADEVAGPDVAECTAEQVSFEVVTQADVLGSPGIADEPDTRPVALRARPGERCAITEWPPLRLAGDDGSGGEGEPLVPEAGGQPSGRVLLTGRQRVIGLVRWRSSCAPAGAGTRVEATLAGGDTVSAALDDPPGCNPATPNAGGFFMTFPESPPPSPLEAELVELPATVPHDGTLPTVVELRNPGDEPVPLTPCPVYRLAYGESGTVVDVVNELNCAAAPDEVAPGGRLRFAVELPVPAGEVPDGFTGTVMLDLYLDEDHQATAASSDWLTTE